MAGRPHPSCNIMWEETINIGDSCLERAMLILNKTVFATAALQQQLCNSSFATAALQLRSPH